LELLEFERKFGMGFRRGIFGSFGSRFFGWIDLDEDFWMDLDGSGFYGLDFVWMGGWMDFYYFGWIFYYFE
jgi:hypothetical protein